MERNNRGIKMHDYNETYEKTLEYFGGDELATSVFVNKYALQDEKGNYLELSPEDMHNRLADEFSRIESKNDQRRNL
jgi:ribonucleoside-diphosphate reductase alpha chain